MVCCLLFVGLLVCWFVGCNCLLFLRFVFFFVCIFVIINLALQVKVLHRLQPLSNGFKYFGFFFFYHLLFFVCACLHVFVMFLLHFAKEKRPKIGPSEIWCAKNGLV